jgi:uncharacterized protein YdcH (DUF465 family)
MKKIALRTCGTPLMRRPSCASFLPTSSEVLRMTDLRSQLLQANDEFRRLANEHSSYSQKLDDLIHKRYLSEEEKLEEVRLKKLKLRLKDEMERIERQYRIGATSVA